MNRIISLLIIALFVVGGYAQQRTGQPRAPHITGTLKADYKKNKKGTPFRFVRISSDMRLIVEVDHRQIDIPAKKAPKLLELAPKNVEEFWFGKYINHNMFAHYKSKGYRHPLRGEVMNEAFEYLTSLNGLFYEHEFTRNYMEGIFADIAPQKLDKKRPEQLKIKILKSTNPDAYMLGNGTLLITTGLLSIVDSVDELMAVMVSEMTHYALDHQVINIGKERGRVRKAKAWSNILAAVAVGIETLLTENNEHYIPGGFLITAGIAGGIINEAAIKKLGMGYSNKQYFDADAIAVEFLKMKDMNTAALSSALYKIQTYYIAENDSYALSKKGGYANVNERIARLEAPKDITDPVFVEKMSEPTTFNAILLLNNKNFQTAERLIEKKVRNGCATDDDYLVLVQANMGYRDSPEDSKRNLELIRRVKTMAETPNLGIYKQEIILLLRLGQKAEAIDAIKEYKTMLVDFREQAATNDDAIWADSEILWSNKTYRQTMDGMED